MTALLCHADQTGAEIWTTDNVGEVIPGLTTPLTWSILEPLGNQAFRSFLRSMGLRRYPPTGLFDRFYGRVYFNQSQFQRLMHRFYPSYLGQPGSHYSRLLGLVRRAPALAELALRSLLLLPSLPHRADQLGQWIDPELDQAPAPETLAEQALWLEAKRWRDIGQRAMSTHLAVTILATLLHSLLDKLTNRWADGTVETAHLLAGLPGMKSATVGRDLAHLAAEAATDPELRDSLLNARPEALADIVQNLPPDHEFARKLEDFLTAHGHASPREFELAFPRWREDPGPVLSMLQSHLRVLGTGNAGSNLEAQKAKRLRATETMRRRLRIGPRRLLWEVLVHWTQRYSVTRENAKYAFVMAHSHLRALYLALAHRLVQQGILDRANDLFCLTQDDLEAFLTGLGTRENLTQAIEWNQTQEAHYCETMPRPPAIIEQWPDGSLHPLEVPQDSAKTDKAKEDPVTILYGVAASSGRVTGRARVIVDLKDAAQLEHGEILIAPSTNPAWVPLLLSASALVTEIGGALSHGAIVAREFGLPAVLNVKGATRLCRTGQLLVVDGSSGTVSLLNED